MTTQTLVERLKQHCCLELRTSTVNNNSSDQLIFKFVKCCETNKKYRKPKQK